MGMVLVMAMVDVRWQICLTRGGLFFSWILSLKLIYNIIFFVFCYILAFYVFEFVKTYSVCFPTY
jgi:hypothetical protein